MAWTFTIDPEGDLPTGTSSRSPSWRRNVTDLDTRRSAGHNGCRRCRHVHAFLTSAWLSSAHLRHPGQRGRGRHHQRGDHAGRRRRRLRGASLLRNYLHGCDRRRLILWTSGAIFCLPMAITITSIWVMLCVITGTAGEFRDQTQISSVSAIANCGAGSVQPVDDAATAATDTRAGEGMLDALPADPLRDRTPS